MLKIGFIDYYLDEWHANNYPKWIKDASKGEMEVAYAYAKIDSPNNGVSTVQWCDNMNISRCSTIEELVDKSDVIIVLSPDNCEMHEDLSRMALSSGKATYIDKTFASDGTVARRIMDLAEKNNTPCFSTSALRYATEYANVDKDGITAINCWGPNELDNYSIHQLEPLMMLMKTPGKRVMYIPGENWYSLIIEFIDGRKGTISGYMDDSPFMMNICSKTGNQVINVESDFFNGFIIELVEFFKDGLAKVPHEDTLMIMDVRGAALEAQKNHGQWVEI